MKVWDSTLSPVPGPSDTGWEALWCRGGNPEAAPGVYELEYSPAIDLTWEPGQVEWLLLASDVSSFLQCKYWQTKQYNNVSHLCSLKFSSSHIFECGRKQKNIFQFSSVTQSCPTLCDPMDCSMPGLSVHHQLPEFTQTHIYWVGDAIQSSHPLSSPPAPYPSQHQSLFQWVNSSHQVAQVLEFQL